MVDICDPNPCKNNGLCNSKIVNYLQTFECLCPEQYYGDYCEKVQDSCRTRECYNGGSCLELNTTHAECHCTQGFIGLNCELDIDECVQTPNLCQNNGVCRNGPGLFECKYFIMSKILVLIWK